MTRALTIRNIYDKVFSLLPLTGQWLEAIGPDTESNGCWIIYGKEKNGKTTFALKLANYLSTLESVLYISAEEGISVNIVNTCKRVGIAPTNRKLHVNEYIPLEELKKKLSTRKSARIIFIDNTTEYKEEMSAADLKELLTTFPHKLFIFLAHESHHTKGEPDSALARCAKKRAKRIFHVVGMAVSIGGRTGSYVMPIDKEKAALCHGDIINQPDYNRTEAGKEVRAWE